jgi:hypothetical protein
MLHPKDEKRMRRPQVGRVLVAELLTQKTKNGIRKPKMRSKMAHLEGFEPPTPSSEVWS